MQGYDNPNPKPRNLPLIVCSVAACGCVFVFIPILAAILFPVFAQARESARAMSCLSNEKQQALAVLMYTEDYDETLPRAGKWMDALVPYTKNDRIFHCPSVSNGGFPQDCGYAFDSRLSGVKLADIASPQSSAMIFESTSLDRSASDACKSIPPVDLMRHQCDNIALMDGHAHEFKRFQIADEIAAISKNPIAPKTKKVDKKKIH